MDWTGLARTELGRRAETDVTRLMVVSHPAVLPVNQLVYAELLRCGWDVQLLVPSRWRHEYEPYEIRPEALPELETRMTPLPILLAGRPQRHVYSVNPLNVLRRSRPDVLFIEQEPFALAAAQWGLAAAREAVPFGVQQAENLDRSLPWPVRLARARVLHTAAFVVARSPGAVELAKMWGARGEVRLVPHHVPAWRTERQLHERFTVGYAGRLSAEKGLDTLVSAIRRLDAPVDLLVAGDGPLRAWLGQVELGHDRQLILRTDLAHDEMASAYGKIDVLVLPSRTTPRWTEQFGRVLVEALWCGVPVVGADSGEIPWVVQVTGGGVIFPEGDDVALAKVLDALRKDPQRRAALAEEGRRRVADRFSVAAVANALEETLDAAVRGRSV
jgi:glycosyltransferase involved in cell wall biosynthesis